MPGSSTELHDEWNIIPSDGTTCVRCNNVIIGTMYQFVLFMDVEPIYTQFKYCEYCYNEMPDKDDE